MQHLINIKILIHKNKRCRNREKLIIRTKFLVKATNPTIRKNNPQNKVKKNVGFRKQKEIGRYLKELKLTFF